MSRYELLENDSRAGLSRGDILVCEPSPEPGMVVVLRRERDGYEPGCSEPLASLAYLSGPRLVDTTAP